MPARANLLYKLYGMFGDLSEPLLLVDAGAGLAGDAVGGLLEQGDEGDAAGLGLSEGQSGLHLGQHGAGRELLLLDVLTGVGGGEIVKTLLVGLAEVDGDLLDRGQDDEHIGVEQLGELGGGKVLVDDGGRAVELAVLAHNGDTTAADRDDDGAVVNKRLDGVLLDNVDGLGGGNDLTVAAACVLDHGVAFLGGVI